MGGADGLDPRRVVDAELRLLDPVAGTL